MSALRAAADVAALLPLDDPLGLLARQRLAVAARHQERTLSDIESPIGIGRDAAANPRPEDTPILIGAPMRDAAVDPRPEDFPGVPNAGLPGQAGNPHGCNVRCIEVGTHEFNQRVRELREAEDV